MQNMIRKSRSCTKEQAQFIFTPKSIPLYRMFKIKLTVSVVYTCTLHTVNEVAWQQSLL